jgi:hypothetical protein
MGLLALVFPILTCPGSCPGLFTRRSPPRLFTAAARAGLRPAPESRSRGACPHLLRSFTTRISFHLRLLPCLCSTHAVDALTTPISGHRCSMRSLPVRKLRTTIFPSDFKKTASLRARYRLARHFALVPYAIMAFGGSFDGRIGSTDRRVARGKTEK